MVKNYLGKLKDVYLADRPRFFTAGFLVLLFAVYPFAGMISGYGNFTFGKYLVFVLLSLTYFAGLAYCFFSGLRRGDFRLNLLFRLRNCTLTQKAILLFALFAVVSSLLSDYPAIVWQGSGRYEGLSAILIYVGLFLAVSAFGAFSRRYLYLLLIPFFSNIVICLLQLAGYNPFYLYPNGLNYYDGNIVYSGEFLGTIGNAGLLAAFFCLLIPVFICYFLRARGDKWRYLFLVAAICGLYVLIRSQIAAGILAVAVSALLIIPLLLPKKRWRMIYLIVVIVLLMVALIFVYNYQEKYPDKTGFFAELSAIMHGEIDDSFGSSRILIWRECLALVPEHPLFGGGPDTLMPRLDLVFTADGDSPYARRTRVDTAHNDYLQILVNLGALALIAYLLALISSAVSFFRQASVNHQVLICGAGVLCYSIQIFFSYSTCIVAPFFWVLWGMLHYEQKHLAIDKEGETVEND